ncbi:hypothetical protein EV426DRAFT_705918 [Tirmania nivea]|nr:hypothetical protein EV426DRAFT_705918 [Tirmania nivea]
MVTAKHLIKNSKADLGWDTCDADYTAWRNAVKDYCAQHLIRTWSGASEAQRDALVIPARSLTGFRASIRARLAAGSDFPLLQDCLKKGSETAKNLAIKRARKRIHAETEDSDGEDEEADGSEQGTAVIWDIRDRRKLGIIRVSTLDGIWDMVKAYVPANRRVREILGALKDPSPLNTTFLRMSTANPVRLMVVLHAPEGRENSPPLDPTVAFLPRNRFEPPNEYDDPAEDSDALVRDAAGVRKRRMPTKDHTFEKRKYEIRKRIERQERVKSTIKFEHKRKFPDADIIDSEHEDYCYIRNHKKPKCNTGLKLVKARQVVGVGHRATQWNRTFGVRRFMSKLRGINAAQTEWHALNANADDSIPGVAPLPAVIADNYDGDEWFGIGDGIGADNAGRDVPGGGAPGAAGEDPA